MAKRDPAAEAITRVAALKAIDEPAALAAALVPLLADKSSYVVSRAAAVAADRGVRAALPAVIAGLQRFLDAPSSKDAGCTAKQSLARALVKLEADAEAEEVLLAGVRHAHWESAWGGQADLAVGLRGQCAIGLAAMGSKRAMQVAAELLAESDLKLPRERVSWSARADAARALTMIGNDGAAAVLRFKSLVGDPEPVVLSECLAGVIAIERQEGLEFAERFLQFAGQTRPSPDDEARAEAALLAIGGARLPSAFAALQRHASVFLNSRSEATFLAAVALTRQEAAIEYLLGLVQEARKETSVAAAEALAPLPGVAQRLDAALASRR